jgi:hypothetical protein
MYQYIVSLVQMNKKAYIYCEKSKLSIENFDFRSLGVSSPEQLAEMKIVAEKRGGECLSDSYVYAQTKMRWRCRNGHEWEANSNSIKNGTWCPYCSRRKISDPISELQTIANERGGELLSTRMAVYTGER